jgi:hypothetical protein
MNWKKSPALALAVVAILGLSACQSTSDPHRKSVVKARAPSEAFDAMSAVLVQRFANLDPKGTDRAALRVTTVWERSDETDRLMRRRAKGTLTYYKDKLTPNSGKALVKITVERQFSTHKTDFGKLDKQNPKWVGGSDIADTTLEKELHASVRARLD